MAWLRSTNDGVEIHVRVRPGARKAGFAGIRNDELLIDIDAQPQNGKANLALVKFLSKVLGAGSAQVLIVSGQKGKSKVVRVLGIDDEAVKERIPV